MASIGESAKRRKTDNMDVDIDIFNGLFCAEGSYKQFNSFLILILIVNWQDSRLSITPMFHSD